MQAVQQRRIEAAGGAKKAARNGSRRAAGPTGKSASANKAGRQGPQVGRRPNEDITSASSTLKKFAEQTSMSPDIPSNPEDQERLAIIEQLQEQIQKKGSEATGTPEEDQEIERLLHGLVSMCHNAAMELMKSNQTRAAGRVLRGCAEFADRKVPHPVSAIVVKKGIMHAIFNNMAQHANMTADMDLSIEYLEKALESAEQPETEQELLPLAETYLNLANGYSFLTRYEEALRFSEKALKFAHLRCNQLRDEVQEERFKSSADATTNQKVESLDYQLQDFIAIKIMSHLCMGEQQEKLGTFNAAIKSYSEGQKFAETNFGIKHPLYTKCINAMGGAKLKSKYQTKENYRNVESSSKMSQPEKPSRGSKPPAAMAAKKERKPAGGGFGKASAKAVQQPEQQNSIKSKLMARRLQGSDSQPNRPTRRDIQGTIIKATEVKMANMMHNSRANLLLANCDSWTSINGNRQQPQRPRSKNSLIVKMQKQKIRSKQSAGGARPSSVQSERRLKRELRGSQDKSLRESMRGTRNSQQNRFYQTTEPPQDEYSNEDQGGDNAKMNESLHMQSEAPRQPSHRSVLIEEETRTVENQSAGGHEYMAQSERIHQQQMQHMRTLQEDQFKMLQMVIDNNQANSSQMQAAWHQQQQAYMYYPGAAAGYYHPPQFFGNHQRGYSGAAGYPTPPMYHQYSAPQPGYWQNQQADQTNESFTTDTDQLSDAEQIKAGQKPTQSELSKAEMLEQAYQQQQQEMLDMQRRMSEMQHEYNDQIMQMRESQEAFKVGKLAAKSARVPSNPSEKDIKSISHKEFKEDMLDSIEQPNLDSLKDVKAHIMMKDVSAQAFDTFKQSSILKQSTMKSRGNVNYHQSVMENGERDGLSKSPDVRSDISNSFTKTSPYRQSMNHSMTRTSFITEKSFRIPGGRHRITKNEAAIIIQKNYRRFRLRQDFKMAVKSSLKKKFLFKATIRSGNETKLLTCSLGMRGGPLGKIQNLTFVISDSMRSSSPIGRDQIVIDLSSFEIQDTTDMKDKVLAIIRDALSAPEINQRVIEDCFMTHEAMEILEADFFSSDDYAQQVKQPGGQQQRRVSRPPIPAIASRSTRQNSDGAIEEQKTGSSHRRPDSAARIQAEIAAIRKRCEVKCVVDIGDIKVKGHRREMDAFDGHDEKDEELSRHFGVESDDEQSNTKRIVLSQVRVSRQGTGTLRSMLNDNASSGEDSEHDYQFVIGGEKLPLLIQRTNYAKIVKVQSLVRGFLARLWKRQQKSDKVIYNRILQREGVPVRFMLVKKADMSYRLSACVSTGSLKERLNESKFLSQIPFEDDDATEKFEQSLIFSMTSVQITDLDLQYEQKPMNPFLDTHLFILDYQPTTRQGDNCIKTWQLRDTYPCEFFQVNGRGESYYKVVVTHYAKQSYLKLHKLPEDMKYMAYYFNEVLQVALDSSQKLNYIYLKVLPNKWGFKRQMRDLEAKFLLTDGHSPSKKQRPKTASNIILNDGDQSRYNTVSVISESKTVKNQRQSRIDLRKQTNKVSEFLIIRDSLEYIVEVFDETLTKGRYQILVFKRDDPTDNDTVQIAQITQFMDELVGYVRQNLKIYTKQDGRIDYLSLNNDTSIYSLKNKRRVRESLSQARVKEANSTNMYRGSSLDSGSVRHSIESYAGAGRVAPELVNKLNEFTIERFNTIYRVHVQERKNYENKPLQITVTAQNNSKDSKYMVYHNKDQMSDGDLITYLKSHLAVYTKINEITNLPVIQYVSLTQGADAYRYCSTVEASSSVATKKSLVKSRANKARNSVNQILTDSNSAQRNNIKSFTIDQTSFRRDKDSLREFSPSLDPEWEELTRETVQLDNGMADVILMSKQATITTASSRRGNIPLPQRSGQSRVSSAAEYYRIILMHCRDKKILSECDLSPAACNWLLTIKPSNLERHSALMTAQELVQLQLAVPGQTSEEAKTQLEQLKQSTNYQSNMSEWSLILRHVTYDAGQVKFDLWQLCQSRQANEAISSPKGGNRLAMKASRPKTVTIQSKLNANRKVEQRNFLSSEDQAGEIGSGVDRQSMSDTLSSLRRDTPSQNNASSISNHLSMQQLPRNIPTAGPITENQNEVDFEDFGAPQSTIPAVIRTQAGQYVQMTIYQEGGSNYYLTLYEKLSRSHICNKIQLPAGFVAAVATTAASNNETGIEPLEAVKQAVEDRIRNSSEVKSSSTGQLNMSIFEQL